MFQFQNLNLDLIYHCILILLNLHIHTQVSLLGDILEELGEHASKSLQYGAVNFLSQVAQLILWPVVSAQEASFQKDKRFHATSLVHCHLGAQLECVASCRCPRAQLESTSI